MLTAAALLGVLIAIAFLLRPRRMGAYLRRTLALLSWPKSSLLRLPAPSTSDAEESPLESPSRAASRKKKKAQARKRNKPQSANSVTTAEEAAETEHTNASTTEEEGELEESGVARPSAGSLTADASGEGEEEADADSDSGRHVRFAPLSESMLKKAAKKAARKAAKLAATAVHETLDTLHTLPNLTPAALDSLDKLYRPADEQKEEDLQVAWPTADATATSDAARKSRIKLPFVVEDDIAPIWRTDALPLVVASSPIHSTSHISSIPAPDKPILADFGRITKPKGRPQTIVTPPKAASLPTPSIPAPVAAELPIPDSKVLARHAPNPKHSRKNRSADKEGSTVAASARLDSPLVLVDDPLASLARSLGSSLSNPSHASSPTDSPADAEPSHPSVELPQLSPSIFAGFFATSPANDDDGNINPRAVIKQAGVGVIGGGGGNLSTRSTAAAGPESLLFHGNDSNDLFSSSILHHSSSSSNPPPFGSLFSFMKDGGESAAHHAGDEILQPAGGAAATRFSPGRRSSFTMDPPSSTSARSSTTAHWHEDDLSMASSTADYDELMAEYEAYRQSPLMDGDIVTDDSLVAQTYNTLITSPQLASSLTPTTSSPLRPLRELDRGMMNMPPHASASGANLSMINGGSVAHPRPPMHIASGVSGGGVGSVTRHGIGAGGLINPTLPVPHQWAFSGPSPSSHASNFLSTFAAPGGSSTGSPLPLSPAASLGQFATNLVGTHEATRGGNSNPTSAMQTPLYHSPAQSPPLTSQLAPGQGHAPHSGGRISHYQSASFNPPPANSHYSPSGHYQPMPHSVVLPPSTLSTLSSLSPQQVSQLHALLASASAQAQASASVGNINWNDHGPSGPPSLAIPSAVPSALSTPTHAHRALTGLSPPPASLNTSSYSPSSASHSSPLASGAAAASATATAMSVHQLQQQQLKIAWQQYVAQAQAYIGLQQQQQGTTSNPAASASPPHRSPDQPSFM